MSSSCSAQDRGVPFYEEIKDILSKKQRDKSTFNEVLKRIKFEEMYNVMDGTYETDITEEHVKSAVVLISYIVKSYPQCFEHNASIVKFILELFPFFSRPFSLTVLDQVKDAIINLLQLFYARDLERFRVAFEENVQILKGKLDTIYDMLTLLKILLKYG